MRLNSTLRNPFLLSQNHHGLHSKNKKTKDHIVSTLLLAQDEVMSSGPSTQELQAANKRLQEENKRLQEELAAKNQQVPPQHVALQNSDDAEPGHDDAEYQSDPESVEDDDLEDSVSKGSGADDDMDEGGSADLTQGEKDILEKALAAVQHITASGGGAKFDFDVKSFFTKHLLQWRNKKDSGKYTHNLKFSSVKESVGGGRTQTGKTALKVALAILGKLCGVTVVVVTTTTGNRDSICDDLKSSRYFGQLTGDFESCRPECTTITTEKGLTKREHDALLDKCIHEHGTIIVNLTNGSIDKCRMRISQARGVETPSGVGFALIKDEGDTFDRCCEGEIKVNMTLSFSGSEHDFEHQKARLKELIATTVQRQRCFSRNQLEKLVEKYRNLARYLYEELNPDAIKKQFDDLAQELNALEEGKCDVNPDVIRAWIKKMFVSLRSVKTDYSQGSEGGEGKIIISVRAPNIPAAHDIERRLSALDNTLQDFPLAKLVPNTLKIRSVDPEYIKLERSMHQLTGKLPLENVGIFFGAPCSILTVTATTLPIFLRLLDEDKMYADVFIVDPKEDYVGVSTLNMEPTFLVPNELRLSNEYWSDKVQRLYEDAHPPLVEDQKTGVLLLDAVNPRVTAHTNIWQRATKVKRKFPRFHIIVLSGGGGMSCSFAGDSRFLDKYDLSKFVHDTLSPLDANHDACISDTESDDDPQEPTCNPASNKLPKPSISKLLTAILKEKGSKEIKDQGITNPIAVIGYTRMLRGESFVSSTVQILQRQTPYCEDRRLVPTHMLCGLLERRSVEDLVQMLGRATFNDPGRKALDGNMGRNAKIKILIQYNDWDLAVAYYRFQDGLFHLLRSGKSIQEVLELIKHDFASDIRPFMGKRTIGAKKRNNTLDARFERPKSEGKEEHKIYS
jgi:hypothetical protein